MVVVDVVDDVRGFGSSVVVVSDVGSRLFSLSLSSLNDIVGDAGCFVVDVVEVVVVVVVEVVDVVVVVVGYETFVSKKLVTWSSTSTNSHDLKI